jgi:hypothetical protein
MKLTLPLTTLAVLLAAISAQPQTSYHVEIKCEQKRFDVKRSGSESTEVAEEKWGYSVTIANHSFKEVPDLQLEYLVFAKHEKFGSKSGETRPERTSGKKSLGTLQNNGVAKVETDPITLKKARLKADWFYSNGAKGKAKDEITGIWVRAYSGSVLIGEFLQPATLKTQEKWEG